MTVTHKQRGYKLLLKSYKSAAPRPNEKTPTARMSLIGRLECFKTLGSTSMYFKASNERFSLSHYYHDVSLQRFSSPC